MSKSKKTQLSVYLTPAAAKMLQDLQFDWINPSTVIESAIRLAHKQQFGEEK